MPYCFQDCLVIRMANSCIDFGILAIFIAAFVLKIEIVLEHLFEEHAVLVYTRRAAVRHDLWEYHVDTIDVIKVIKRFYVANPQWSMNRCNAYHSFLPKPKIFFIHHASLPYQTRSIRTPYHSLACTSKWSSCWWRSRCQHGPCVAAHSNRPHDAPA